MKQTVTQTTAIFYFPFTFEKKKFQSLVDTITKNDYTFFNLNSLTKEVAPTHTTLLDQFFYPFIQTKLFPKTVRQDGFNRFIHSTNIHATTYTDDETIPFQVDQISIHLCPFETGIITVQISLQNEMNRTNVLEFLRYFRQLKPETYQQNYTIRVNEQIYRSSNDFVFLHLMQFIQPFIKHDNSKNGYNGSLPFFEDERMYTTAFIEVAENVSLTDIDLYRIAHLDGQNEKGFPTISNESDAYMDQYIRNHCYKRWEPKLYITTTLQTQTTVTSLQREARDYALLHFTSTSYYNLLIHYFYKIVLLRLSYEHSEIRWSTDKILAESLSEKITMFSSKYYFSQVSIRSAGRELTRELREHFHINELFQEVKQSVADLYRVLEDHNTDRYNQLLFILTVFTVISGIIGMNLVIDDWEKPLDWSVIQGYTFFEWVTFITGITGIALSFALIGGALIRAIVNAIRKKKIE